MKRKIRHIMRKFLTLVFIVNLITIKLFPQDIKKVFSDAEKQTTFMLQEIEKAKEAQVKKNPNLIFPCSLTPAGDMKLVAASDWRSGFFPGVLWYLYEFTGNNDWKAKAILLNAKIENEKWNAGTHDMGFKIYCSFGNGYRLTGDKNYRDIIIQSAKTNIKRFNPKTGCIRSWDHNKDKWDYPVIIDNMMNLELLFEATKLTGDSIYYKVAVSHANTTMKNHFRPDFSSYHVIDYDTITGNVTKKNTHQGYSHESAWSRGQAWGLYGFTMCYRETKDKKYLDLAEKIAGYILKHPSLPEDLVPYWDYNAPGIPNEPRDVSAAAITASALYELSGYSKNGKEYKKKAGIIIKNLTDNYRAPFGTSHGFILLHSTGSKPSNSEVDLPLNYADYYYLEALLRSENNKK
jgi:unsaturated chondroitin disaccharide hydrolase